jgi:hypothetical protein|nr:MAG TPA: hypothetical protein [Caudoviricetes sp.]
MDENEAKTGTDALIERIVEALEADASPEWNPAPSWADHVLTWEGLRALANGLLGRKSYDGRDPLAEPVLRGFLESALNAEGYVVLPRNGNSHYGPLCPQHEARHKYEARKVGTVPDPSWAGAVCVDCCRTVGSATHEVDIYVW